MLLDVMSPRGLMTLAQEREAVAIWKRHHPAIEFSGTPKSMPADVDGVLHRGGELLAVVETKCRDMTVGQLMGGFEAKWLVTFEKIVRARKLAVGLGLPLSGWLYLPPDKALLTLRICEPDGTFVVPFDVQTTTTQRTVNGGSATRSNAFISMTNARVLR